MTGIRIKVRGTTGSTPPVDLQFRELAFSDTNDTLYVGKADGSTHVLSGEVDLPDLATVATSGNYNDLTGKPALFNGSFLNLTDIPSIFPSDWAYIANKPFLFSGAYADLTGKPTLFSGAYSDLTGKPSLFSGSYSDLADKPTLAFTYDQQPEPPPPLVAGQTWRERSAGGLIVGEWEWSSAGLWLSREMSSLFNFSTTGGFSASNSTGVFVPLFRPRGINRLLFTGFLADSFVASPLDASNRYEFSLAEYYASSASGVQNYSPLPLIYTLNTSNSGRVQRDVTLSVLVSLVSSTSMVRISGGKVGTPGNISGAFTFYYRGVRA